MTGPHREQAAAVVLSMAVLALGTLLGYRASLDGARPDADHVEAAEQRLAPLRAMLPARGTVGYLSDRDPQTERRRYFLTQYALAPVVVAPDARRELVVANCASPAALAPLAAANRLTVVRDFQNGVALLRRDPR
jgi:hypothetical protein